MKETFDFSAIYPFWGHLSLTEKERVKGGVLTKVYGKGGMVYSSDESCMGLVTVLKGDMKVSVLSEDGRQVTLFHVEEGENCVTTASCVIAQLTFDTLVTAERESTILVLPSFLLAKLAEDNIYFKAYLFERLAERFSTVVWVMEQILFRRLDQRLADYLLSTCKKTGSVEIQRTQEEIATEINTAREVVARMLKQFSQDGILEVKRGRILLRDLSALEAIQG